MSNIEDLARKQALRNKVVDLLGELKKTDPAFWAEIGLVFSDVIPAKAARKTSSAANDEHFARIKGVLEARKNAWTDTSDILKDAGITKPQANYAMTKTHADKFDKRDHPDHGKKKQWRLKTAA